jgi:hypothetical protein
MSITINGSTGIAGVDGSAGTPSVQGADTNTGMFFPAADTVGVSTGGTERMRIDSSGNVGVGTSSPAAKLEVSGAVTRLTSTNPNLQINSMASPGYKSNINFLQSGSAKYEIGVDIGNNGNNNLFFYDNVVGSERARIDSSGNWYMNSGYGSAAVSYGCRAWVNFDGTTSPGTIRASGNVSSITRNGNGDYTINFTSALVDANYSAVFTCGNGSAATGSIASGPIATPTTSAVRMLTWVPGTNTSYSYNSLAVFR